jgi:hypothetical protein
MFLSTDENTQVNYLSAKLFSFVNNDIRHEGVVRKQSPNGSRCVDERPDGVEWYVRRYGWLIGWTNGTRLLMTLSRVHFVYKRFDQILTCVRISAANERVV